MKNQPKIYIDKIAQLARVHLSEAERENLTQDLLKIISYVEKVNSLDIEKVEATSHVLNLENVFREDTVKHTGAAKDVLSGQPDSRKDRTFFKVPKVIED